MALEVDAIYEDGNLQLLSPVMLQKGERVKISIVREHDQLQAELNAFLAGKDHQAQSSASQEVDLAHVVHPLYVDWGDGLTASEMIIEERESREY